MGISTRMKVHQCRENGAHAYSAATPVLRSVLIFSFPALPLLGRRAKAHSGGGELLGKTDGAVMDIGAPSVKDSLFFAVFSWMVHIPLWQLFDSCSS